MNGYRSRIVISALGLCCLIGASAADADVYFYRDAEGVLHFSSRPTEKAVPFDMSGATVSEPEPEREPATRPRVTSTYRRPRQSGRFDPIIEQHAREFEVEPALVKAMIRAESAFNPFATSHKGARGLMQLMPATARSLGVRNAYNAHENIRGGVRYLRGLLDRFRGNVAHALAAYNAGAGAVSRYRGIPPYRETQNYVRKVLRYRREYQREERLASF